MKSTEELEYAEFLRHVRATLDKEGLAHVYDAMLDHDVYTRGTGCNKQPRLNKSALGRKLQLNSTQMKKLWNRVNSAIEEIRQTMTR